MGITNFDGVQANFFIGPVLEVSPFASTFYVDGSNGNDGNDGLSPFAAKATIGSAITASTSGRGDNIVIAPGTYTVTAAIVPKAGNVLKAAIINPQAPSVKIVGNIADVVQVDVNNVKFVGIEFKAGGNTADNLVDIADTTAVSGCEFYFCTFNGDDKTSVVGIQSTDATVAVTGLVVKGCLFRDLTGTMINIGVKGMPYADIQYNAFALDVNGGTAIALADTAAFATGKGFLIANNDFTGFDVTADEVAITIAGTEDTTGAGMIRNNYFAYTVAAAITADKISQSVINNYVGDRGTGGTLVDSGTA